MPERKQDGSRAESSILDVEDQEGRGAQALKPQESEGAELDRAFGGAGT